MHDSPQAPKGERAVRRRQRPVKAVQLASLRSEGATTAAANAAPRLPALPVEVATDSEATRAGNSGPDSAVTQRRPGPLEPELAVDARTLSKVPQLPRNRRRWRDRGPQCVYRALAARYAAHRRPALSTIEGPTVLWVAGLAGQLLPREEASAMTARSSAHSGAHLLTQLHVVLYMFASAVLTL